MCVQSYTSDKVAVASHAGPANRATSIQCGLCRAAQRLHPAALQAIIYTAAFETDKTIYIHICRVKSWITAAGASPTCLLVVVCLAGVGREGREYACKGPHTPVHACSQFRALALLTPLLSPDAGSCALGAAYSGLRGTRSTYGAAVAAHQWQNNLNAGL